MTTHPAKRRRRADAAKYLQETWGLSITKGWLDKSAGRGDGPVMQYDGPFPTYTDQALDEFARARLSKPVRSTAGRRELQAA